MTIKDVLKKLRFYGYIGTARLSLDLLATVLLFPKAKLIRRPFDIRNRRFMDFGTGLSTGRRCRLEAHPESTSAGPVLRFGKNVRLGDNVQIVARRKVSIGDDALVASGVFISDLNHGRYSGPFDHSSPDMPPDLRELAARPVVIEAKVWIGQHCAILPGVTIGEGSIVGSCSVVTKNVPPYSIAVGLPARVVKVYSREQKKWLPLQI